MDCFRFLIKVYFPSVMFYRFQQFVNDYEGLIVQNRPKETVFTKIS